MWSSPIERFRIIGFLEGFSLIVLLFFAMPMKYWANYPIVVTIIGSLHGLLFTIYVLAIFYITYKIRWSFKWMAGAFLVAFIPFGNLVLDKKLKKLQYIKKPKPY